jgi:very-short-patch-repair endonuclease
LGDEGVALVRIWRKQRQDPYNRETLLGLGILRASAGTKTFFGPVLYYRVKPVYDPESRTYRIEKLASTACANLTLLAQPLVTGEELAEIRGRLFELATADTIDAASFGAVGQLLRGSVALLSNLSYVESVHRLADFEKSPACVLGIAVVLLNVPRGNAYLLDDVETLAATGSDNDLTGTAVGSILAEPRGQEGWPHDAAPPASPQEDLLFPLPSNRAQRRVAHHAETSRVVVVHGPPGTGKSQTICNLISHLAARGKTVLVTSQKNKALEVVRDKLPAVDYLAMPLLRGDAESQKLLLNALDYYQGALGSSDPVELQRAKKRLEARLDENQRNQSALEARFSELRRLEHQHFPTFRRMADLRDVNVLDPDDDGQPDDVERLGRLLENYAEGVTSLSDEGSLLDPSSRKQEAVQQAISVVEGLRGILAELSRRGAASGLVEIVREIECLGIEYAITRDALRAWIDWIAKRGQHWVELIAQAARKQLAGSDLASLRRLAAGQDPPSLKRILRRLSAGISILDKLEEAPLPTEYAGRRLPAGHVAEIDKITLLLGSLHSSVFLWYFSPSSRRCRRWLAQNGYSQIERGSAREQLGSLSALSRHWRLRYDLVPCLAGIGETGMPAEPVGTEESTEQIRQRIEGACLRIELALIVPPAAAAPAAPLGALLERRLNELSQSLEAERDLLDSAGCVLELRDQCGRGGKPPEVGGVGRIERAINAGRTWVTERIAESCKDIQEYAECLKTALYLSELERSLQGYTRSLAALRADVSRSWQAPLWVGRAKDAVEAHRLFRLARQVNASHLDDTNAVSEAIRKAKREHEELVTRLLAVQRRLCLRRASENQSTAFAVLKLRKLLEKKKKTVHFEKIKNQIDFTGVLRVFPCWIMSIDDVARVFPLMPGLFDYLIVDEASQCDQATALHLAYRAKRLIVVGDEKQLPNAQVQWLKAADVQQLLERNGFGSHPKKEFLSAQESLLSLARASQDREVYLDEHFRCDPRIIEWSNDNFYNGSLRILTPLRSRRFAPAIEVRYIPGATESEQRVNATEAAAVLDEVARLIDDPKLSGLTIGIISPFQPQADYIYQQMQQRFAPRWSECERRGLTAATADGFQGDERDIILYSLRHGPGSHPSAVAGIEANQGDRRLNVAFTRARRKAILFCSLPPATFPGKYIRGFLAHAAAVQKGATDPLCTAGEDHFDSEFERDVCMRLRSRVLQVVTQFPVAGYRVDLVARDQEGRRLAIECDGEFHYDESGQLREEDYERQEIIERAGWVVHRIPARRFYLEPEAEIERVLQILSEQATDSEVVAAEGEDLSDALPAVESREPERVTPLPLETSTLRGPLYQTEEDRERVAPLPSESPTAVRTDQWIEAPFAFAGPWLEAARWGVNHGLSQETRTFLWNIGDAVRREPPPTVPPSTPGGPPCTPGLISAPDRERASQLWSLLRKRGFTPSASATGAAGS